jgi:hypothetical protein
MCAFTEPSTALLLEQLFRTEKFSLSREFTDHLKVASVVEETAPNP